jgi:hypothetical protein
MTTYAVEVYDAEGRFVESIEDYENKEQAQFCADDWDWRGTLRGVYFGRWAQVVKRHNVEHINERFGEAFGA